MNKRIRKKHLKKIGTYVPDSATWNLDITIAKFVLPRLKVFKKVTDCYPCEFNSLKEWHDVLDKMIESFYLITNCSSYKTFIENEEDIKQGLDLFIKYYHDLWW